MAAIRNKKNLDKRRKSLVLLRSKSTIAAGKVVACLLISFSTSVDLWAADYSLQNEEAVEKENNATAWYNEQGMRLPSAASRYGIAPGILLAAGSSDANPQGTIAGSADASGRKSGNGLPAIELDLKTVGVKAKRYKDIGPMPGLILTKEQIPGNIQTITAKDIKDAQSLSITDILNSKLQSVNVNDYQGNPFQMDVTYRGFTAGPQIGTPQGLSVFLDGIRVNEPFGDVVNWDMIPMNAISTLDVIPGSNPLFGLNTLGGALAVKTKSGFDSPGISAQVLKGSYGRNQLQASGGWNNGDIAAFGALNVFMEDGWRDNSPSKVNQAFGKLEWQGERASLGISTLAVVNKLIGNGTVPLELYKENPSSVFTSPDETRNRLLQMQISGAFDITDKINVTGMVYQRDSRRISSTGDIIDIDSFRELGKATRKAANGELVSCVFLDANGDGFPNYYVDELVSDGAGGFTSAFRDDLSNNIAVLDNLSYTPRYDLMGSMNPDLPSGYIQSALQAFPNPAFNGTGGGFDKTDSLGQQQVFSGRFYKTDQRFDLGAYASDPTLWRNYYTTVDAGTGEVKRFNVIPASIANRSTCPTASSGSTKLEVLDASGNPVEIMRDGAQQGGNFSNGTGAGYIQGTPTGIITKSNIDQTGHGGTAQINFNLDNHRLMFGTSLDSAGAKYNATQRFGLLDSQRNVYADGANIGEEYYAGDHDVPVNAFDGTKVTKSLYFSETWTPTQTLNFSASARYNETRVSNSLAARAKFYDLTDGNLINRFLNFMVCPGGDIANCPFDPSKPVDVDIWQKLKSNTKGYNPISPAITEKFSYYSLNPAFGVTWQANPRLNMYTNWNQGTRTPSVIELGCAYDDTPTQLRDANGNPVGNIVGPRTLIDGRACSLPSVLSGDPYLPQVKAETMEVGARGKFKDAIEWNVTAYRTDLKDDLYLVAANSQLSFFQNIGETRRQGIEFGLAGEYGKSNFRINYSLSEATFQSEFKMLSPYNSSTISNNTSNYNYNQIQVEPGDRMPGVPLNNLNISWGYKLTPEFKVSLGMVAHGDSFVRGNENNEHTAGPGKGVVKTVIDEFGNEVKTLVPTPDYRNSGKSPGYAVFNFRATYDLGKGWSAGLLVNNLFDKTYFSAGRLGLSPFAPSTYGAIGAGGFNYNSSEWQSTQFMSAGAPRGLWLTVSYDFDASKKYVPASTKPLETEPDRSLEPARKGPTAQELALEKALDTIKPVPVLNAKQAMQAAEQQVTAAINEWHATIIKGDADAYFKYYGTAYNPDGVSRDAWLEQRKLQLSTAGDNPLEIAGLIVVPQGRGMTAVFTERYQSAGQSKIVRKALNLEQQEGRWVIVRETILRTPRREVPTSTSLIPTEVKYSKFDTSDHDVAIGRRGRKP